MPQFRYVMPVWYKPEIEPIESRISMFGIHAMPLRVLVRRLG